MVSEGKNTVALLRALKVRAFALLWTGQTISRMGDYVYQLALAWWVLEKTGSPAAMSAVMIFSIAPMLIFLLIGGVAVDRFPRVRVMVLSDVARGLVTLIVAVLAFADRLEIWHIYLLSLIFGLVDSFFTPAYTAAVPELTPATDLTSANSLTSLSLQAGRIIGPGVGAVLMSVGGAPLAFLINGLSFFVSAACLLPLLPRDRRPQRDPTASKSGVWADLREGFITVAASPWIWITILVSSFMNVTLSGPYSIALPFLVESEWKADVNTLALLYIAFPLGYVVASVGLGRLKHIPHRGLTAYGGSILAGLGMLVIGLPVPLILILAMAFVNGAGLEAFSLIWVNTLQEMVPPQKLGRVSSLDWLGNYALLPIGFGLTGWAVEQWGAAMVCVIGGGMTMALSALALLHPAVRGLE
jgi:DHA3 family tetracycline resistance protein-like MFS transporter